MDVIITTIGANSFSLNGVTYSKTYTPVPYGKNQIEIYNTIDERDQILFPNDVTDVFVDGVGYNNQKTLIDILLEVIYSPIDSGGPGTVDPGYVVITWENLVALTTREAGQKWDIVGSLNTEDDFGKVTLTTKTTFEWVDSDSLNNTIEIK